MFVLRFILFFLYFLLVLAVHLIENVVVGEEVLSVDHSPGQPVPVLVVLAPVLGHLGRLSPGDGVPLHDAPEAGLGGLHREEGEGSLAQPRSHHPPGLATVGEPEVSPAVDVDDDTPRLAGDSPGYEPKLVLKHGKLTRLVKILSSLQTSDRKQSFEHR